MNEFKTGDLVYCPTEGTKVFNVAKNAHCNQFSIIVGERAFSCIGMYMLDDSHPVIFHATKARCSLSMNVTVFQIQLMIADKMCM